MISIAHLRLIKRSLQILATGALVFAFVEGVLLRLQIV